MKTILRMERLLSFPFIKKDKMILRESELYIPPSKDVREDVINACKFVWEHCSKRLTLSEIAAQCSLTPAYLSEVFKKDMKMTLTEFIEYSRMSRAVNALVGGEAPIKDIAIRCGFHSASYFCKRFKEVYGITAMQFRKREAEEKNRKLMKVKVLPGGSGPA